VVDDHGHHFVVAVTRRTTSVVVGVGCGSGRNDCHVVIRHQKDEI